MVRFSAGILPENLLSFLVKRLSTCKNMEGYGKFPDRNLARSNRCLGFPWLSMHNPYKILTEFFGGVMISSVKTKVVVKFEVSEMMCVELRPKKLRNVYTLAYT